MLSKFAIDIVLTHMSHVSIIATLYHIKNSNTILIGDETLGSNVPPETGIRIPPSVLSRFVVDMFTEAGMSLSHAERMADLLVQTDLRGVHSHGSYKIIDYIHMIREGRVNPCPKLTVVNETPTTRVYDGDGGLGHFPCFEGTTWAIKKAKEFGTSAITTQNHFHFGGAGKYTRMAIAEDCFAVAVSSHRSPMSSDSLIKGVNCTSPISVAFPSGEQPPLVVDMGASMLPWDEALFERMPFAFFKELGIGAMNRVFGGMLAGIYLPQFMPPKSKWESNQGSFIAIYDVNCFMPADQFKREVDRFIEEARAMKPFPGFDTAELPGGLEWQREQDYARDGIPISDSHREGLEALAQEVGIATPFGQYDKTRF
jgi:L-2-hydroxycarboxylate dehydrogenase (NAD+)